jgi:hypothetical protein
VVVTATGGESAPARLSEVQNPDTTLAPGLTDAPTVALVTLTAGQDLSCVKGPHWALFEWVAHIYKGETVTLLARSTAEWPDYYYARKDDGTECWAFGGSSVIHGDPSILPEKEAPALPSFTLIIENKTRLDVCDVFLDRLEDPGAGADQLATGILAPGATFSRTYTAGFFDIIIRDCFGGVLYEK